ncbi:MAG: sulfotransferase family 2 domain-containing protein [Bacteroidetes bacterium]|nr:sulfotransferase family 2 domain-containing protein [Bacteroidota bacterium]
MSTLFKSNAVFLHVPKTGGTFFRKIIVALDLRVFDFGYEHADMERTLHSFKHYPANAVRSSFLLRKNIDSHVKLCFKFCFVRNPYGWYESYWRFMQDINWNDLKAYRSKNKFGIYVDTWNPVNLLLPYANANFNVFIESVLNAEPGFLTKLYEQYADPLHINYLGRQETLEEDIKKIFDILKISYDKNIFEKTPRANESKTQKPIWSEELKNRVYDSERGVFEKYKYNRDGSVG